MKMNNEIRYACFITDYSNNSEYLNEESPKVQLTECFMYNNASHLENLDQRKI